MNKPWIIWGLSGLCALLVFAAMAVISQHTLTLEKERAKAEGKAELEERIRLALWRVDSAAAGLLAEENGRPPWHFRELDLANAQFQLTPLNRAVPEPAKLHFEVQNGVVSTPLKNDHWGEFNDLLRANQNQSEPELQTKLKAGSVVPLDQHFFQQDVIADNLSLICAVANVSNRISQPDPSWGADVQQAKQQRSENPNFVVRNSIQYQTDYNKAEKVKRQEIVGKSSGNQHFKVMKKPLNAAPVKSESEKAQLSKPSPDSNGSNRSLPRQQLADDMAMGNDQRGGGVGSVSPLIPVWLGDDLLLVREVVSQAGTSVQGVWLDADAVEASLLTDIVDLLPNARLGAVKHGVGVLLGKETNLGDDDPMVMAALPWRLIPGENVVSETVGWTPMRKTLLLAWVGVALASIAAVVLLRGVIKLSERRASFVSSVTHELRTPLTTFSLYSDMLAEGMVQDEVKRQEYLHTLRRESARLTHLVENVLAYSRIERGSAQARVETVQVKDLVGRMLDRLQMRAADAGMQLSSEFSESLADKTVCIDTTAVEQIIFNLVDNACKYASGEGCGQRITLRVVAARGVNGVAFQVTDEGAGIDASEHRRLFKAFHKSAQDAADTKPGVGLGLALSRRLARALGGDLKIIDSTQGACFELTIR